MKKIISSMLLVSILACGFLTNSAEASTKSTKTNILTSRIMLRTTDPADPGPLH